MMQRAARLTANKVCSLIGTRSFTVSGSRLADDIGTNNQYRDRFFMNDVSLIGRVGAMPEERGTGKTVVVFPMVTKRYFQNRQDGTEKEFKEWHRIVIGGEGNKSIALSMVQTGSRVMVQGRICYRQDENGTNVAYIDAGRLLALTAPVKPRSERDAPTLVDGEDDAPVSEDDGEVKTN